MEDNYNSKLSEKVVLDLYQYMLYDSNNDIYSDISNYILMLKDEEDIPEIDAHKLVTKSAILLSDLITKNYNVKLDTLELEGYNNLDFDVLNSVAGIRQYFKMVLYPIEMGYKLVGKTQHDFNIDINFFHELRKSIGPTQNILHTFKFDGSLLIEFSTKNPQYNVIHYYNDLYEQVCIEFLDGEKLPINTNEIETCGYNTLTET